MTSGVTIRQLRQLYCPASARIISSFDFKHRTSYNTSFIRQLYYIFAHNTVIITDLAPQVAGAIRGGSGKIKINEICYNLCLKETETYYRKGKGRAYLVLLWTVMTVVSSDLLVGLNVFEILSSIAVIMTSSREKGKSSTSGA